MTGRAVELRDWLERAEKQAAAIVADRRLPLIRDIQTDHAWRNFISEAIDPARYSRDFDNARMYLQIAGKHMDADEAFDKADATLRRFDLARQYLAQMVADWDAAKILKANSQRSNAGKVPKRRKWAELLAGHISCWDDIPESFRPLELEQDSAVLEIYRDHDSKGRECVYCVDADLRQEVGKLTRASFERRYLKKATGQQRR